MTVIQKEPERFESERYGFGGEFSFLVHEAPEDYHFAYTIRWENILESGSSKCGPVAKTRKGPLVKTAFGSFPNCASTQNATDYERIG